MLRALSAQDYRPRLERECLDDVNAYVIEPDGAMYRKGAAIDLLRGPDACGLALKHAVAFVLSGQNRFREFASAALSVAEAGLVECRDGLRFWPMEPVVSLCAQGRCIRTAYYAARAVGDDKAIAWLADMMDRWPYLPQEHRFVERMLAGPQKPTSVGVFSHSFNMLAEGGVDGWMLGKAMGNQALMERAEDEIVHFILPHQREDGHWDYRARSESTSPTDACGPEEYNYSMYLTVILSNLLQFAEWRDLLVGPIRRSYEALRERFEFPDGSIYAPVHWGPNHIFESTLFSMILAWRFHRHVGMSEYGEVAARALHWSETVQMQNIAAGLFWERHFMEMLLDDFKVEGEVAELPAILQTLRDFERRIATPQASHPQYGRYHADIPLVLSMRRKIQSLADQIEGIRADEVQVARWPEQSEPLRANWRPDANILSYEATFAWDQQYLHASFRVANDAHWQPYEGLDLFRGDGVILQLRNGGGAPIRVSLALTQEGPVVFRYNPDLSFGVLRTWLTPDVDKGVELSQSSLTVHVDGRWAHYTGKLAWEELGLAPAAGMSLVASFTVTKLMPIGFQHLSWGEDPFDPHVSGEPGRLTLL